MPKGKASSSKLCSRTSMGEKKKEKKKPNTQIHILSNVHQGRDLSCLQIFFKCLPHNKYLTLTAQMSEL